MLMSKKLRATHIIQPPRQKDESKVSSPPRGPALCTACRMFFDRRTWKTPTEELWRKIMRWEKGKIKISLCPSCKTIKEHLFGGEIEILRIPSEFMFNLIRLIHRFTEKAEAHSQEQRLIAVEGDRRRLRVTTTENQLAGRLAKKIMESFKNHAALEIVFSREPHEKQYARLTFLPTIPK